MRFASMIVMLLWALCSAPMAMASDYAVLSPERTSTTNAPRYLLSAGVGGGRYADDGVMSFRPGFHMRLDDARLGKGGSLFGMDNATPFALDIVAPMHFTVVDRGLEDHFWRGSEYNQASEFLSLIRRVELGRLDGPVYLKTGALTDVRLGHGTIVDRYTTNYGMDYRRWGVHLQMQSPVAGGTFMIDDIVQPGLVGARVFVAPWAKQVGPARALAFGMTMVGDFGAPQTMTRVGDELVFDRFRQPMVEERRAVGMIGFDLEAQAVDTLRTRMTFYTDLNLFFPGGSAGWHTGSYLGWQSGEKSVFSLRGEFRLSGNGYMPGYFSKAYEVSRLRVAAPFRAPVTLQELREAHAVGGYRSGYLVSLQWDHSVLGHIDIGVEGGSGQYDESFYLQYASPADKVARFAFRYELPWLASWKRVHVFEQAALSAELQVSVTPWLMLWGQGGRRWRQAPDGDFRPQTDVQAGATFYYAFPR